MIEGATIANEDATTGGTAQRKDRHSELGACHVIGTTIDHLLKLPDLHFDLVLVEEASQVAPTGLLKVMTKVMRGSEKLHRVPRLILCGDPQQLPPFQGYAPAVPTGDEDAWEAAEGVRETDPVFSLRCRYHAKHNPKRVTTLTLQHRMHPEIAMLVSGLFYSDQEWRMQSSKFSEFDLKGDGVWWIDTHGWQPARSSEQAIEESSDYNQPPFPDGSRSEWKGRSRFNLGEVKAIEIVVKTNWKTDPMSC